MPFGSEIDTFFSMKKCSCPKSWLKIFKAISDPVRQNILEHINQHEPINASAIVQTVELSQPTVSHHLKILLDAEIISAQKNGKETLYSINNNSISACCMGFLKKFCPEEKAKKKL